MGKVFEKLGMIEGHDIIVINKRKAKKDELFKEIEKYDNKIKEETRKIVNEQLGIVYAIKKDNLIKGLYLFEIEKTENEQVLKHIKTVYSKDVSKEVQEKYDNLIVDFAKEYITYLEYDKVIFNDKVVQIDPKRTIKQRITMTLCGAIVGFVFGYTVFNDFFLGIVYAIVFSTMFNGLDVVVIKNKKTKKKTNKK